MKPENIKKHKASVFDTGGDLELRVDLDRNFVFLDIVQTTLKPDMVSWSKQAKTLETKK